MSEQSIETGERIFYDVSEVSEILRQDQRTVRRALEAGTIPGVRTGRHWRIPVSWIREKAGQGAA